MQNKFYFIFYFLFFIKLVQNKNLSDFVNELKNVLDCSHFETSEEMKILDKKFYKDIDKENYFEYNYDFPDEHLNKDGSKVIIVYKFERNNLQENHRQTQEIIDKLLYVKQLQSKVQNLNDINIQNYYGCFYKTQPKFMSTPDKMSRIFIVVDYIQKYFSTDFDMIVTDVENQLQNFQKKKQMYNLFLNRFLNMKEQTDFQFVDLTDKVLYTKGGYSSDEQLMFALFDQIPNFEEGKQILFELTNTKARKEYYQFYPKIVHGCFIKNSCHSDKYMIEQEMWTLALFTLSTWDFDTKNFFNETLHCPFITVNSICVDQLKYQIYKQKPIKSQYLANLLDNFLAIDPRHEYNYDFIRGLTLI